MSDISENNTHQENKISNINDLFIKESEDTDDEREEKIDVTFSSSESDEPIVNRDKSKTIRKQPEVNKSKTVGIDATNGIKLINQISNTSLPGNLADSDSADSTNSGPTSPNKPPSPNNPAHKNMSSMVENMLKPNNVNGWDEEANTTLRNWYHTFRQQSFVYQWVLDHNNLMSERLAIASIVTSSTLGIFAGFKLWIPGDVFQTASDIVLILCNFGVALITAMSRRYGDDKRTDSIRSYVSEIDEFLGEISAQVLKSPVYRMNADEFFQANNDKYTKLITSAPNMSLEEIAKAKNLFKAYSQEITLPV